MITETFFPDPISISPRLVCFLLHHNNGGGFGSFSFSRYAYSCITAAINLLFDWAALLGTRPTPVMESFYRPFHLVSRSGRDASRGGRQDDEEEEEEEEV